MITADPVQQLIDSAAVSFSFVQGLMPMADSGDLATSSLMRKRQRGLTVAFSVCFAGQAKQDSTNHDDTSRHNSGQ